MTLSGFMKGMRDMKRYMPLAPAILFPYVVLLALVCVFNGFFMESVFQNNGLLVIFALLAWYVAALVCAVITTLARVRNKHDARGLLRVSMVIKLIHIPSYLLIFVIGAKRRQDDQKAGRLPRRTAIRVLR